MRISGRHIAIVAGVLALGMTCGAPASAQTCGDADGSGSVTVTDGVQVLRSAAGLSSTCSAHAASCDVDGSGGITVSDGVNVLRKAAGISISESCPGGGDGTADVAEVTDVTVPFLVLGLQQIPNVSVSSAGTVRAAATEQCEDGGSRMTTQAGVTATVTFNACRVSESGLGSFQFDGQIQAQLGLTSNVTFALIVTDLSNDKVTEFQGTIQGTPRFPAGGFVVDGGPLSVRGSNAGPEIFRLTFNQLTVDQNGHLVSGSVEAEDTSDSFALDTAELEVQSSTTATVHVVRDDQSTQDYQLNLTTGDLTPVG